MRCSDGVVLVRVSKSWIRSKQRHERSFSAGVDRSLSLSFVLFFVQPLLSLTSPLTRPSSFLSRHPPTKQQKGVENLFVSKMLEPGTNTRTHPVARHAGVALSGVAADGRQVALRAQGEALSYKNTYGSPIPGKILCDRVASYVHAFNLYWYVRPFGCVTLLATFDDEEGPALYAIDPAGGAFVSFVFFVCVFFSV